MNLLTLNCHSWQEENQEDKIKYLAKVIAKKRYDVIALQEISGLCTADHTIGKDNYVVVLVEELKKLGVEDYKFVWDMSHIGYDKYDEGVAILTRHDIQESESFYISQSEEITNYKSRKIVKATINVEKELINFFSCHLGWWNDEDESFKEQVAKLIKHSEGTSFFMGDFNNDAFVRNEGYDYLLSQGLYDTYKLAKEKDKGVTVKGKIDGWSESEQLKRLDLILTNKKVEPSVSRVIFNGKNEEIVSDHYGVEVILY